ncbi:MAG: hypothetical protein AAF732_09950 [Pseudomonadota bacterium]
MHADMLILFGAQQVHSQLLAILFAVGRCVVIGDQETRANIGVQVLRSGTRFKV